jgi:hypothetical protein
MAASAPAGCALVVAIRAGLSPGSWPWPRSRQVEVMPLHDAVHVVDGAPRARLLDFVRRDSGVSGASYAPRVAGLRFAAFDLPFRVPLRFRSSSSPPSGGGGSSVQNEIRPAGIGRR